MMIDLIIHYWAETKAAEAQKRIIQHRQDHATAIMMRMSRHPSYLAACRQHKRLFGWSWDA